MVRFALGPPTSTTGPPRSVTRSTNATVRLHFAANKVERVVTSIVGAPAGLGITNTPAISTPQQQDEPATVTVNQRMGARECRKSTGLCKPTGAGPEDYNIYNWEEHR